MGPGQQVPVSLDGQFDGTVSELFADVGDRCAVGEKQTGIRVAQLTENIWYVRLHTDSKASFGL